jgi:SAM-dependent methyltransferase
MPASLKKRLSSGPVQLNIIGVLLLVLLVASAWNVLRPPTLGSIIPLLCIGYAAFCIIFELTFNRANVPTLATGFIGRRKITKILRDEAARHPGKTYTIIDLGSGRGELTRRIAKGIPNATVIGLERTRFPCWQASLVQRWLGPKNLSYRCCDFWPYDCASVDAVVFYLTPTMAQRVGEKLYRELKPGSVVISHTFPLLGAWMPVDIVRYRSPFKETLYIYKKN